MARCGRVPGAAIAALLLAVGCGGGEGGADADDGEARCVSDLEFFQQRISLPILEKDCIQCHNPQGAARHTKFVLAAPGETGYLRQNFETLRELAAFERDGTSLILLKPTLRIPHEGGERFAVDSEKYRAFEELVGRFREPVDCGGEGGDDGVLGKVRLLGLPETLRKVKLQIVGELPTADELDRVSTGGEAALDALVAEYLERDAFYANLKRWWNDQLLTDKYLGGDRATSLLDEDVYPGRFYYRELPEDTERGRLARQHANNAVARQALDLIEYVVRNDRPFTEILTADYMVVTPFSAPVFGVDVEFEDPLDPRELRPAKLPGVPHAGILTTPMFLNRFPTTETNRNRHRSRMVWKLFLATDILKKAEQPVDPTQIRDHNPTMNNPQCTICHAQVDPLAGAFMNWDAQGRYVPPETGWHDDMRPPGFGEEAIPPDDWPRSLQWTAQRIAADERFALAAVSAVYTGLVGRPPVENPTDDTDPRHAAKLAFYNLEQAFLNETKATLVERGYDIKAIVPIIVRSPFYRARSADGLSDDEAAALEPLGTMRLLTPEELDARLRATVGYPWKRRARDRNLLLHPDEYRFFYGGIDSDQVIERVTEPNGIMANIALRMAAEMGCLAAPRDFRLPAAERRLFPHVEITFVPQDANGFEVPGAVEAIRKNIRYLHYRILGEVLSPGDPQEEATYRLFVDTWREGWAKVRNGQLPRELPGHCRAERDFETDEAYPEDERLVRDDYYVVRAWSAVLTYLLADWRFLYHQ